MKRFIVIGCPGSGKSTFSRALQGVTQIPLYHLDMMNWNSDRTTVSRPIFNQRLHRALKQDTWIIDGNYSSTMELRFQACDTVFFLDYSLETSFDGIMSRRGKERTDIPWIELPDYVDEEFVQFVKNYNTTSRPIVMELLNNYTDKDVFIFKNREEADEFISQLSR